MTVTSNLANLETNHFHNIKAQFDILFNRSEIAALGVSPTIAMYEKVTSYVSKYKMNIMLGIYLAAALYARRYIGYSSSNRNNRIQASTTKPGKSGCCSVPTCNSHLRSRRKHSSPKTAWTAAAQLYPNLEEAPRFVKHAKENAQLQVPTSTADPERLQGKQRLVYDAVHSHMQAEDPDPLRMIVSGMAGTGKSFLIHCLKALLLDRLRVMAPTGVAAFKVRGFTLHSLLHLPTCEEFNTLEGERPELQL